MVVANLPLPFGKLDLNRIRRCLRIDLPSFVKRGKPQDFFALSTLSHERMLLHQFSELPEVELHSSERCIGGLITAVKRLA